MCRFLFDICYSATCCQVLFSVELITVKLFELIGTKLLSI